MDYKMDYKFPQQLFPAFYNCGPPDLSPTGCAGGWGSYDGVQPEGSSGPLNSWTFTSRYQARGDVWCPTEPVPIPLLSPKNAFLGPLIPPDPMDFREHMQNFFTDHCQDAFGRMSNALGENFYFGYQKRKERYQKDSLSMWRVRYFLDILKYKICQQSYRSSGFAGYCSLLSDVIHDIPPDLLGSLLNEELIEQRDCMLFFERCTGGALVFVPFSQSSSSSQHGCLIYPGRQGLDRLNFHKVELQYHKLSSCLDANSNKPVSFQLKAPIRQISYASHSDDTCVAVRSDHLCGVWRFSERSEPRLLQVVNTKEVVTCVNVSPHILGEVLVANESTVANLWTVGKGMQKVRVEDSNLYFNAKSSWRWCEFSGHPRVMLYADRTGAELTDMRAGPLSGHTLFRISSTSQCRSGERLMLCRYLGDVHSFHHLITTQYSAYIMDERFPCIPMLKWDHMMLSPPMFCCVAPNSDTFDSVVDESSNTNLLLGSHSSQEITLLQYSGGRVKPCFSKGPPQALLRPRESLKHLPVQIPHRLDTAANRLSSFATGVTCIQKTAGGGPASKECMCVLQLTEAGDIFYQVLEHKVPDHSSFRTQAGVNPPQQAAKDLPQPVTGNRMQDLMLDPQMVMSETIDEDIDGPARGLAACTSVAAMPESEQRIQTFYSDSSSESEGRRDLKLMQLYVHVGEEQVHDELGQADSGIKSGSDIRTDKVEGAKIGATDEDTVNNSSRKGVVGLSQWTTPVKPSHSTSIIWKHWLQKLIQKTCKKKSVPQSLQHFKIRSKSLLCLPGTNKRDASEKGHVESLRKHIKSCMSRSSLLVQSTVSASLGASDIVSVPNQVDTEVWKDPLSHRLSLSWHGEGAWQEWWEEQLGMNRGTKLEALRRKRRKEKDAKRAAGHRLELSGSFTSSVSYQSELDDFSSSAGWSSGWSDREGGGPLSQLTSVLEHERQRAPAFSSTQTDILVPNPSTSSETVYDNTSHQQIASVPCDLTLSQRERPQATATSPRKSKRLTEDSLSSLFSTQDDFVEKRTKTDTLPGHEAASSSQLQSRVHRDARLAFPSSQSSQGRPGLSQASQPKKKSRMGF